MFRRVKFDRLKNADPFVLYSNNGQKETTGLNLTGKRLSISSYNKFVLDLFGLFLHFFTNTVVKLKKLYISK